MFKETLSEIINWIFSPLLKSVDKEIKEKCFSVIKNKLNRNDIKEIAIIIQLYFTQENFDRVKEAIQMDALEKIKLNEDIDYESDLMWGYQVKLSDNTTYVLIFDDIYQDPYETPKPFRSLRYFHEIKTPIKMKEKDITYKKEI